MQTDNYSYFMKSRGHIIATHDLSYANFIKAVAGGGIQYPSFALSSFRAVNEDSLEVGFAGGSDFGPIRVVADGSHLLDDDGFWFKDGVLCTTMDSNTPMIPSLLCEVEEGEFFDHVASLIPSPVYRDMLMEDLMEKLTEDLFDDGPVPLSSVCAELSRITLFRYLYNSDLCSDLHDDACLTDFQHIYDNARFVYCDPRFPSFIEELVKVTAHKIGMVIDGDFIEIDESVSELDLVEANFELYPHNKIGGLLDQVLQGGGSAFDSVKSFTPLFTTLFSRVITTIDDLHDARHSLSNSLGSSTFDATKSQFRSDIRRLEQLFHQEDRVMLIGALSALFEKLHTKTELTSQCVCDAFSEQGIFVTDDLKLAVEACFNSRETLRVPYFEFKWEGAFPLEFASHVVVPEVIGAQVKLMMKNQGLDIPVYTYKGDLQSVVKFSKARATYQGDVGTYSVINNGGYSAKLMNNVVPSKHTNLTV